MTRQDVLPGWTRPAQARGEPSTDGGGSAIRAARAGTPDAGAAVLAPARGRAPARRRRRARSCGIR